VPLADHPTLGLGDAVLLPVIVPAHHLWTPYKSCAIPLDGCISSLSSLCSLLNLANF
jgi:hypothetical protein